MPAFSVEIANPLTPFDAIADSYDQVFTDSHVGRAQRSQVWREMDRLFGPGQRILEINCGTGADALHLAGRGIRVVACDSSPRMIDVARRRLAHVAGSQVELRVLPTEALGRLEPEVPFDGVLSNFAGLNCTADLRATARQLARLVRPGGRILLCLFGRSCAWEISWHLFRGDLKKGIRRWGRDGGQANIGSDGQVEIQYPSLSMASQLFSPEFRLIRWRGIGVLVPPSYLEHLAVRFPRIFRAAASADPYLGRTPVLRGSADHIALTFERVRA